MNLESLNGVDYSLYSKNTIENNSKSAKKRNNFDNLIFIKRPDGRYTVMTKEQYIRLIAELERRRNNPTPQSKQEPYELGPKDGESRIIDTDNVSDSIHRGSTAPKENSCSPEKIQEYKENIEYNNGKIDDFKQGKRGDCYLLAAIDSIRRTENGQEILNKNVQKNSDGSYTVTLPGALNVREHYIQEGNGDKCAITGTYTITPQAIEKAKAMSGKSYAYGDIEVLALELAMEAFRAEVIQTNKALGIKSEKFIAGQIAPRSDSDPLSGGQMYDAVYMLTGRKSDVYIAPKEKRKNIKLYRQGEYGYVGEEQKLKGLCAKKASKGIVEVEHVYNKDSELQKILDKYKGHEDEYSITVGVIVAKNGPDGSTKAGGGHALTVKKITDNYVEVVNPWDTSKVERIPRGDFEAMTNQLHVAPVADNTELKDINQTRENNNKKGFFEKIREWFRKLNPFNRPQEPPYVPPNPFTPPNPFRPKFNPLMPGHHPIILYSD